MRQRFLCSPKVRSSEATGIRSSQVNRELSQTDRGSSKTIGWCNASDKLVLPPNVRSGRKTNSKADESSSQAAEKQLPQMSLGEQVHDGFLKST